jgi:hypothetical protein
MTRRSVFFDPTQVDDRFLARFWSKVDKRAPDECWPWLRSIAPGARYGTFAVRGRATTTANRVALALSLGRPLTGAEYACHTCDNPPCCNPAHLFAGTPSENNFDAVDKGRFNAPRGERHRDAILTEDQVREIRAAEPKRGLYRELASRYGVAPGTVHSARVGISWKHLT